MTTWEYLTTPLLIHNTAAILNPGKVLLPVSL